MDENVAREMICLVLVVAAFVAVLLGFIHFAETGSIVPGVPRWVEIPGEVVDWLVPW